MCQVFAGLYPVDNNDLEKLKDAMQKLTLNDSSVTVTRETRLVDFEIWISCMSRRYLHISSFISRYSRRVHVY